MSSVAPRPTTHRSYGWYLLVSVTLAACSIGYGWYTIRYPSWREEVLLSDGRVIWIEQKHEYYENYGTNQSWVTFSLPEMGGKRTWHSYLKPMRVDVHQGKVFVFGRPRGDRQVQHYQYPRHYIVAFQWSYGEFKRMSFLDLPEAIRAEENVLPCVPNNRSVPLIWDLKDKAWCPPSGVKGEFGRTINISAYRDLAITYARRDGGSPKTE